MRVYKYPLELRSVEWGRPLLHGREWADYGPGLYRAKEAA